MSSIDYFGASDDQIIWIRKFGIDVGQGINVGPGNFVKKNKRRALTKRRAYKLCLRGHAV